MILLGLFLRTAPGPTAVAAVAHCGAGGPRTAAVADCRAGGPKPHGGGGGLWPIVVRAAPGTQGAQLFVAYSDSVPTDAHNNEFDREASKFFYQVSAAHTDCVLT